MTFAPAAAMTPSAEFLCGEIRKNNSTFWMEKNPPYLELFQESFLLESVCFVVDLDGQTAAMEYSS